jgi:tRNA 2-thiouridine synthesizing protein A
MACHPVFSVIITIIYKMLWFVPGKVKMSALALSPDKTLDCSGMLCPMPVIKTSKAIKEVEVGQVLKVIATDPGSPPDMAAWSRQTGNELLDSHQENGAYVFFFRRLK